MKIWTGTGRCYDEFSDIALSPRESVKLIANISKYALSYLNNCKTGELGLIMKSSAVEVCDAAR